MKIASQHGTAVVPFGVVQFRGTCNSLRKGITMDFSLMNKILEIREKDFLVRVQPGVTRSQLNKELKSMDYF